MPQGTLDQPFIILESTSVDDVRKLTSRSVLIKGCYELWCQADNRHDFHQRMRQLDPPIPERFRTESFRIDVESYNHRISLKEKIEKIEELNYLPFAGDIKMTSPDHKFVLFEWYQLTNGHPDVEPMRLFFGEWISDGNRRMIHSLSLKKRKFISNTSMDPVLSLIMANIAKCNPNHVTLDPFVGSGSLLVAAASFGSYVMGVDIDYKLLHGLSRPTRAGDTKRSDDETIYHNLQQYHLEHRYLDTICGDSSKKLFGEMKFDQIICDPPYGIREASQRVGTKKLDPSIPNHLVDQHFPAKVHYFLEDIVNDLLDFSSDHLNVGGRVVFWMPLFKPGCGTTSGTSTLENNGNNRHDDTSYDDDEEHLSHGCLKVMSMSEQKLQRNTSRVLISMEKVREKPSDLTEQEIRRSRDLSTLARNFKRNFYSSVKERIERKKTQKEGCKTEGYN